MACLRKENDRLCPLSTMVFIPLRLIVARELIPYEPSSDGRPHDWRRQGTSGSTLVRESGGRGKIEHSKSKRRASIVGKEKVAQKKPPGSALALCEKKKRRPVHHGFD